MATAAGLCLCLLVALSLLIKRFEGDAPDVGLALPSTFIGPSQDLVVTASDSGSGIRKVFIGIFKDGREQVLVEQAFPAAGLLDGGQVNEKSLQVSIDPAILQISDGPALLRVAVSDYSWRNWGEGNRRYIEKQVIIDTRPPVIHVLSRFHNVAQGGSGMVVYRISEPCETSGVRVDDEFYPGQPGPFEDESVYLAMFALRTDQDSGVTLRVTAADAAGNTSDIDLPHYVRQRKFRKDVIQISDGFLNRKLPEFRNDLGSKADAGATEQFLWVNRELRRANYNQLRDVCRETDAKIHWKGAFLRLPASARKSAFGDRREYRYKGEPIDRQYHLGVDLASLSHSTVPAANSGRVVFAERLGIYGNTVVLDHGYGLFTMYSHLSSMAVAPGQMVSRGETIGQTGTSGLAGGDHLHFAVMVNHTFVEPLEWWDADWIRNNVTTKIDAISSELRN